MTERHVAVRQLIELLPDLVEFDALRQCLQRASSEDAAQQWASRAEYSTVDRRVVAHAALGSVLASAESEMRARLKRLYEAATIAFTALSGNDSDQKAHQLIELGERAEGSEQWRDAIAYYLLAHGITRNSTNLATRALVLRRVGRSALNIGDFSRAAHFYSMSLATAATVSDAAGQIIAATGLGNVASYQGRWREADDWYSNALTLCAAGNARERAQLLVNRSMATREQHLFDEARSYLEDAAKLWNDLTPGDRAGWYNNMGLLLMAQGEMDDAETCYTQALDSDPDQYHRAMVLDNLAELALRRGNFETAAARCREAETVALTHGSPRALAEVYMRLGRISAQRQDANGVAFFDKALEITRDKQYPLLNGDVCYEYARFRSQLGDSQAARSLFEQALAVYAELGAATKVGVVQGELAGLAG
jgi:tetratricopeptide (TPR) repeat protein